MRFDLSKMMVICLLIYIGCLTKTTLLQGQALQKGLRLGATIGTGINNFNSNLGATTLKGDFNPFALGAAAHYISNRVAVGGEFYQLSGNQSSATESMQFIGSVTSVSIGYCIWERNNTRLEASLGFGFSNNQVISQDKQNTRFENITNNQMILNPCVSVYRKMPNNLCLGLRLAYAAGINGASAWKYRAGELESVFKSDINAFSIQLYVGGIVDLIKK